MNSEASLNDSENSEIFPLHKKYSRSVDFGEQRHYNKFRKTMGRKILKSFGRKKKRKGFLGQLAKSEKEQRAKEVLEIFRSDKIKTNNIKSLQKERKINDTIVAIISLFLIMMCFYQVNVSVNSLALSSHRCRI